MTTPTTKQTVYAAKLFARHADIAKRHGAPMRAQTFEADMAWLEMDPNNGRDVSAYINMYHKAASDALAMRRF
jgi:hypothetical protein